VPICRKWEGVGQWIVAEVDVWKLRVENMLIHWMSVLLHDHFLGTGVTDVGEKPSM
jgi:hypothetical protein